MKLAVVDSTKRDGELVADSAPERPSLGKPQMMGIRRCPTAHETRLPRHEFPMILIAQAYGFPQRANCPSARRFAGSHRPFLAGTRIEFSRWHHACDRHGTRRLVAALAINRQESFLKSIFDNLGISRRQCVLGLELPMGPGRRLIRRIDG
jgi:hypothetical protein